MSIPIQLCAIGEYQTLEDRLTALSRVTDSSEESFEQEFSFVREALKRELCRHWSSDEEEFMIMNEYWSPFSRVLPMGMYGARCFCQEFLETIQSLLRSLETEWVVHIAGEPEDFPDHEFDWALIFVTREQVYVDPVRGEGEETNAYPDLLLASLADRESQGL